MVIDLIKPVMRFLNKKQAVYGHQHIWFIWLGWQRFFLIVTRYVMPAKNNQKTNFF